jgi:ribosomal protein L11 methyltransferase
MAVLGEIGFESFVENENEIEAYIPQETYQENQLQAIDFNPLFTFTYSSDLIPDQNWNEVWEKNYFKPLLVADVCLIRAPFHTEYPKAEFEIVIEPKMAFGTGNHETTSLMIESILENDIADKKILDMGCGTGILSMLASMKGAKIITAIDIDKWAYESTVENCEINECKNVNTYKGDATLLGEETYDIIFANIHKNILINDMDKYNSVLNNEGLLFMSGFYENDLDDISNKAKSLNIKPLSHKIRNKWVAAAYKKNQPC